MTYNRGVQCRRSNCSWNTIDVAVQLALKYSHASDFRTASSVAVIMAHGQRILSCLNFSRRCSELCCRNECGCWNNKTVRVAVHDTLMSSDVIR